MYEINNKKDARSLFYAVLKFEHFVCASKMRAGILRVVFQVPGFRILPGIYIFSDSYVSFDSLGTP